VQQNQPVKPTRKRRSKGGREDGERRPSARKRKRKQLAEEDFSNLAPEQGEVESFVVPVLTFFPLSPSPAHVYIRFVLYEFVTDARDLFLQLQSSS
jgi:hypothetical protein